MKAMCVRSLLAVSGLWGCEAGSSGTQGAPLDAAFSADGGAADPVSFSCQAGQTLPCTCTDGVPRGTQTCGVGSTLSACQCTPLDAGRGDPGPSQPGALCAGLASLGGGCTATPYVSKELPSSLLFVVDRSRSMLCNLPPLQTSEACEASPKPVDPAAPTKWKTVQSALAEVFKALPGGNALAGLSFFSVDGACGAASTPSVPLARLDDVQRSSLASVLSGTLPDGQTPIVGATILAYAHLHQEAKAPGNRFVILLTDGAESCAPEAVQQLLEREVQKARDANVRTFVIGAPGSEGARALLSELAFRGGTAARPDCVHDIAGDARSGDCHFDMTKSADFAAALAGALKVVSDEAVGCEFSVPQPSGAPTSDVNVQYTSSRGGAPECFPKDDSAPCEGGANGWQFARTAAGTPDLSKVRLCGSACQAIRTDLNPRVDVLVGCEPIVLR